MLRTLCTQTTLSHLFEFITVYNVANVAYERGCLPAVNCIRIVGMGLRAANVTTWKGMVENNYECQD